MIMSDPATSASPASATPGPAASTPSPRPGGVALRRTGWDVALGAILLLTGMVVLGDVVLASVISVLFWLIGILLGVHLFLDGIGLLLVGRPRLVAA
jgi:hypothetical protein